MTTSASAKEAQSYLIDPLIAPEPSQETGPGSHFYPPAESVKKAASPTSKLAKDPFRDPKHDVSSHSRHSSRGSTGSASKSPVVREGPSSSSHRRVISGSLEVPVAGRPRRASSLSQRYPGDSSHKPLDMLRRDSKKAHRGPHLNKRTMPGPDTIDRLDPTPNHLSYHHEGPYDAALLARNRDYKSSPIAALEESNREALKATPAEKIKDALDKHQPLDGVASVPPGQRDKLGRVYNYEEGTDMMREANPPGGAYKQWPGEDYDRDDLHGQGEPSFSLDRALQNHTIHEREFDGQRGIELSDRPLMSDYDKKKTGDRKKTDDRDPVEIVGDEGRYSDVQHAADRDAHVTRTSSLRKVGEGLKKRLSMKKRNPS